MGRRRVRQGRGGVSTTSNSPPSNGSTGSTTVACSANSATSRQQSLNTSAIVNMSQPDRPGLKQTSLRETRGGSDNRRALLRIIRRYLRKLLIWLPGGTVILPRVRWVYRRLPFLDWRRKRYAASEARRIRSAVKAKCNRFVIIIDYEVFGINYGEMINVLALARYINAQNCHVDLYLAKTEFLFEDKTGDCHYKVFYRFENPIDSVEFYINDIVHMAEALLSPELSSVQIISANEFEEVVNSSDDQYLLFEDFVRDCRFMIGDCFNLLNKLLAESTETVKDYVLFSSDEFKPDISKSFPNGPYVSWNCRYSAHDTYRQTTPGEFRKGYEYLRTRFPSRRILIVSDPIGCQHYSALAQELEIDDLLFSREYSTDLLGDAALIMNSEFFFFIRGGGIGIFPILSRMPYEMSGPLGHETMWDRRRLTSWQEESQRFVVESSHRPI